METDISQDPMVAKVPTHQLDPTHPAPHSSLDDSEQQVIRSPSESIFSDDDDIWFEASDQLANEIATGTATPPLTPPTEKEAVVPQLEPESELDVQHESKEQPVAEEGSDGAMGYQDQKVDASLATQKDSEVSLAVQKNTGAPLATQETIDASFVSQDTAVSVVDGHQSEVLLAEAMVKELRKQQKMAEACKAEARYVEVCTAASIAAANSELVSEGAGESIRTENDGMGMGPEVEVPAEQDGTEIGLDNILPKFATTDGVRPPLTPEKTPVQEQHEEQDIAISAGTHNIEVYLAESLVKELRIQQKMAESCKSETRYMGVCTSALMSTKEPVASEDIGTAKSLTEESDFAQVEIARAEVEMQLDSETTPVMDLEPTEHVQKNVELDLSADNDTQDFETPQQSEQIPPLLVSPKAMCDANTNTEPVDTYSQSTNTSTPEFSTQGVNTDLPPVSKEIGCNTMLNCFDVLQRAKEMEELQFLKVEHRIAVTQMNEAKSQKMVAEQLTKIVQSDLAELRQQNLTETTRRLQLENELSDAKIDLSQTSTLLKEKEERVQELEESLSGTSLLVRKLEEQNAVSLMSRGGIDYMLQAKLAEGRAQEAEQKLEIVQSELLQTQSEVQRLLDRVAESSRDRSEMVSSRVHTQLIQIADERAQVAERRNLELEREVQNLRGKLSVYEAGGMGGGGRLTGSTGLTSFSGLSGLGGSYSASSGLGSTSFGLGSTSPGLGSTYSGLGSTSSGLGSTYSGLGSTFSPFSYTSATTKPLSLSEQYNIHSDLAPPTFSTSATPTSFSSSFLEGVSNGGSSRQLSDSAIYSNSDISGLNKASGVSGVLKPSQMFKKHGNGSHDQTTNGSHAHLSHVTSSEAADGGNVELPSFETTPSKPHSPPKVTFNERAESGHPSSVTGGDGDGNDSESSDWSSSSDDEGEGEGEGEGGEGGGIKPSHHTNLIAEWEWRTMADSSDTSSAHPSSPLTKRRVPPPVAPKPHGVFKTGGAFEKAAHFEFEPSSSFDMPTHSATIQGLRRSRGPRGRSLPSRYRGQQYLVT